MPHLILHYSANVARFIAAEQIFAELHQQLAQLTGLDIAKFKSRAMSYDDFRVGDGSPNNAFVHLDLRLLGGRDVAVKQETADAALAVLRDRLSPTVSSVACQITVDVHDLDPDTYRKAAGVDAP